MPHRAVSSSVLHLGVALSIFTIFMALSPVNAMTRSYPLYEQCDPKWGQNEMGVAGPGERATICKEGCAMTCTAMMLAGLNITIGGDTTTPGDLNTWLENNGGYKCIDGDCNNLNLPIIFQASQERVKFVSEKEKPSQAAIQADLDDGNLVYIAHVRNKTHFVLLTGWDPVANNFTVNDPFYQQDSYSWDSISDVIIYSIGAAGTLPFAVSPVPPPAPSTAVIPFYYPLYKQCDPRWGNDIIETTTVCKVGCLMSSTSMAIGGKNLTISGEVSNPGVLNKWLRSNGGYTHDNDLIESRVPAINPSHISWPSDAMHPTNDIPFASIKAYLQQGRPVIANVMHGTHFVLVTGWDTTSDDTLYVNDPGFDKHTYSYSNDVVGWRLFKMTKE